MCKVAVLVVFIRYLVVCSSGLCMESLCSTTSMMEDDTVVQCLKALYTLLNSTWPRRQLGEDPVLCRELLNVMHRYTQTLRLAP